MTGWQPVPGEAGAAWAALIGRSSIKNANAFLLRAGSDLVVVDPGADAAQVARVNEIIAEATGLRRVFAVLTHCHYDHCGGFDRLRFPAGVVVHRLIHHVGARAIETGDRELTVAYVWSEARLPEVPFDAPLFGADPLPFAALADAHEAGLPRLSIPLDGGALLELLHTPGHSPCSVSLRLGGLLLLGDLVLAPAPGLAGLAGWDQAALLRSLEGIARFAAGAGVAMCGQGHGPLVPAEALPQAVARAHASASRLGGVLRKDDARLRALKAHALDLLEEADHLLEAMVDAVQLVVHNLARLEETEAAAALAEALDAAALQRTLGGLRRFATEFRDGSDPDLGLVLKAADSAARIAQLLRDRRTGEALRATLARRAETLLEDFMACAAGHAMTEPLEPTDLAALAADALAGFQAAARVDAAAYMEAAADPESFRALLIRQLAWAGAARRMAVRIDAPEAARAPVEVPRKRLRGVLVALAEALARRDRQRLVLRVEADAAGPRIALEGEPPITRAELPASRLALLGRLLCGQPDDLAMEPDGERVLIRLRGAREAAPLPPLSRNSP